MSERPPFEESILPYRVTPQLVVRLIELRNVQPEFSRCPYCGANDYWHLAWPASLALSQYLASTHPAEWWRNKHALVIGCGVGLESVVLASLGARVTALDHIPESLKLVQRNCELNTVPRVQEQCRCWLDENSVRQLGQYDVLVGADVLYEAVDGGWMYKLLAATLKVGGMAFFGDPRREGVEKFLEQLAAARFHVQVQRRETAWMAGREEVDVYAIRSGRSV